GDVGDVAGQPLGGEVGPDRGVGVVAADGQRPSGVVRGDDHLSGVRGRARAVDGLPLGVAELLANAGSQLWGFKIGGVAQDLKRVGFAGDVLRYRRAVRGEGVAELGCHLGTGNSGEHGAYRAVEVQ